LRASIAAGKKTFPFKPEMQDDCYDLNHIGCAAEGIHQFCLDFEALILYIMHRRGGSYDESRHHLRGF
jgi:hypothetical protein